VFKFGMTEDFKDRYSQLCKRYPHCRVMLVISLGMFASKPAEDTIKYLHAIRSRVVEVEVDGVSGRETFACALRDDVHAVMRAIIAAVQAQHQGTVEHVWYHGEPPAVSPTLVAGTLSAPLELQAGATSNAPAAWRSTDQKPWFTDPAAAATAAVAVAAEKTKQVQIECDARVKVEQEKTRAEQEKTKTIALQEKTKCLTILAGIYEKDPTLGKALLQQALQ
jgi:hypothetical protein